ncbi:hypothetical protein ElyMa_001021200 [Elysia marginata]|uniref:SMB domain-containing protein n=1 Tax=Elysia marginata TaxID=1093978 RepID=A0AAV4HK09_9GAST|nr:hypothetical protein ElyMa_001021200 [Elysia marginata]
MKIAGHRRLKRRQQRGCCRTRIFRRPVLKVLLVYLMLVCHCQSNYYTSTVAVNSALRLFKPVTPLISDKNASRLKNVQLQEQVTVQHEGTIVEKLTHVNKADARLLTLGDGAHQTSFHTQDEIGSHLNGSSADVETSKDKEYLDTKTEPPKTSLTEITEQNETLKIPDVEVLVTEPLKNNRVHVRLEENSSQSLPIINRSMNKLDDYSLWYSSRNLSSCHQRCGEDTSFPCSCEEKCVVHKTCCEDFANTCPQLLHFALSKFQQLVFASFRCDELSAVFMVESCPSSNNEDRSFKVDSLSKNTASMVASRLQNENKPWKVSSIEELISNAPVTDYNTGIVFANAKIYECNKRMLLHNFKREITGTWLTHFGIKNNTKPATGKNFQEKLDITSYFYVPPKTHPETAGAMCYNNWTISCISSFSKELGLLHVACNTSVSEYYENRIKVITMFWTQQRLAQHICAKCVSDYLFARKGGRAFILGFKVLASLSATPGKISYAVIDRSSLTRQGMAPWWSLTCSNEEELHSAETQRSSCEAVQCDNRYQLTPDKLCKKTIRGEISVQSEAIFDGKKCEFNAGKLFNAAKCFFESLYKIKVLKTPLQERQIYDRRRQMNFTAVRMEMYFEGVDYMEEFHILKDSMYVSFSTAMPIFSSHYCSISGALKKREEKNNTQSILPVAINENEICPSVDASALPSNTSFSSVRFNYCLNVFSLEELTYLHCACEVSSERPRDMIDLNKWREVVSKAKSLQCLREETLELAAKGLRVRVSVILVYTMMILFLDTINK